MNDKSKIALVIQRFDYDITGGAEWHCLQMAKHLKPFYQIDILTTCAKDYTTWEPVLPASISVIDEITIKRFDNLPRANKNELRFIRKKITHRLWYQWLARMIGIYNLLPFLHPTDEDQEQWLIDQGPYTPALIKYINDHHFEYQKFIFFSALYYPTAVGSRLFPDKSIVIPMLHDEKANYYQVYQKLFSEKICFFFNTVTELNIAKKIYGNIISKYDVVGVGIDDDITSAIIENDEEQSQPFIFYAGRIEKNKGCKQLVNFFLAYKRAYPTSLKLLLAGHNYMKKVVHPDIEYLGYISNEKKNIFLRTAKVIIVPSFFESLSLLMLEAMYWSKPVLVNKRCAVLMEHAQLSNGAFAYLGKVDFIEKLHKLIEDELLCATMGSMGKAYVNNKYSWEVVLSKYRCEIG